MGLSKSRVRELQTIPVDRLSGVAAEAMKKMPSHQSFLRQVNGEDNWGPTVDGRILPRHPFDPNAPEVSAEVPPLTDSNLHEIVNGLDRRETEAMPMDELHQLVSQEFGEHGRGIVDAYRSHYPQATPFDLYATIAAASFRRAPAYAYIYAWRTPILDERPGPFHAAELGFAFDSAESCMITSVEAVLEQLSYQNKSVLLG